MKYLVTGASGFIGRHLVDALGATPFVHYDKQVRISGAIYGDVRDYHSIASAVEGHDVVIHLAALIGIPYSYEAPDSYVDTNIKGTLNVLQACKNKRVIIISSSEVYGTARYVPIDEAHPLQAQSPYAATKIAAEKLAESFHLSYGTPVTIVRPFNTYGPGQSPRAVIPTIISQLLAGEDVVVGNSNTTRDFNFVSDTVRAIELIARTEPLIGKTVNIATGKEISIKHLAENLRKMINPEAKIITDDKERLRPEGSEVMRLCGDSTLLRQTTVWRPEYDLWKGLEETIRWMKIYQPSTEYWR